MARLLGIDATKSTVRVAVIRTSYRRIAIESFAEADIAWTGSETDAIKLAVGAVRPDATAIALSGERSFYRRLELAAAAARELEPIVGGEIGESIPFDIDEAVFDHRVLRVPPAPNKIGVFAAVGRTDEVRARIAVVRDALGIEPERVGTGPLPLSNLTAVMAELDVPLGAPIALLDLDQYASEMVVLSGGDPVFARTLSRGVAGLPASAESLARDVRQSISAWRSQGGAPIAKVYLSGMGASAVGALEFLASHLGTPVVPLPAPRLDGITPEQLAQVPRFAKALGLALGLVSRSKGLNLRRGALETERSYPFLREKIPVISGLAAVILVSFGFSTIAELRALDSEKEVLTAKLAAASRDVLGEEITDVDKAKELVSGAPTGKPDEDPLPRVDAFDVMVQLSKAVPPGLVHDVAELDVQRNKVVIQGVVPAVADSDTVLKGMREFRCFKDPKVGRTTQFGENRIKYQLEFELKCEDKKRTAGATDADAGAPAASGSAAAGAATDAPAAPSGEPAATGSPASPTLPTRPAPAAPVTAAPADSSDKPDMTQPGRHR